MEHSLEVRDKLLKCIKYNCIVSSFLFGLINKSIIPSTRPLEVFEWWVNEAGGGAVLAIVVIEGKLASSTIGWAGVSELELSTRLQEDDACEGEGLGAGGGPFTIFLGSGTLAISAYDV